MHCALWLPGQGVSGGHLLGSLVEGGMLQGLCKLPVTYRILDG